MTATDAGSLVPRAERPIFAYLLAALLVETLFFVVLSPLLPVYARELHLGRTGAGVMSACYAIGYGLAAVPAGSLVGNIGQRWASLGGLALIGFSCAAFALGRDVMVLDAARLVTGAGAAAVWAGSIPWLESLGRPGDRGRLIGLAFSAASAGACAGPAVGAVATLTGPRPAFLGLSVIIFALFAAGAVISAGEQPAPPPRVPRAVRSALRSPGTATAVAMVVLPTLAFGASGVLLPLRLRGLGVAEVGIATAYLLAAVLEVIVNPLVGRWFDRSGGALVLRATLAGSAACVFALALPLSASVLLGVLVVSFPVLGASWVPSLAQLSASVEREGGGSGVALGLFNISWAISQVVGAVGGAELSHLGPAVPFLLLVGLFVVGARAASALG
ncbi:MAG TPA: MFS transporter [Solirubrobacteraceae bacterium]|jgi:predicted MFS family arabinose efflux permease|nr:MFS transporter [Solirubrobacteraceae bacterium]